MPDSLKFVNMYFASSNRPGYFAEIDGLRAIAVLFVVIYHSFPETLKGGFVGVDIFFVISGFLISRQIFGELENKKFSLKSFYMRRIKRIFPALILVLFASLIFGWFALLGSEYSHLGKHVFGGTTFASNFFYWSEAVSYLNDENETKPMLHLWSLAVEEQFYIFWPFIILLAWKFKFNLFFVTLILTIVSFNLNIFQVNDDPAKAFFWPTTRFWEILSGGLLAYFMQSKYRKHKQNQLKTITVSQPICYINKAMINIVSIVAVFVLFLSAFYISEKVKFPGYVALLPVTSTLLLILIGSKSYISRIIFMNPFFIWIGIISYPLYLWHWPILSFLRIVEGVPPTWELKLMAILLSVFLSWLTYVYVESFFRFKLREKISVSLLILMMMVLSFSGVVIYKYKGFPERLSNISESKMHNLNQIGSAGRIKENSICREYFSNLKTGLCMMNKLSNPEVLILGDSHALHLYEGVSERLNTKTIAMIGGGWRGKHERALDPLVTGQNSEFAKKIYDTVSNTKSIETIIISHLNKDAKSIDYIRTFDYFESLNMKVVYVIGIPKIKFNPESCFDFRPFRFVKKRNYECSTPRSEALESMMLYRNEVDIALKERPSVISFDTAKFLCNDSVCFAKKNNKLLYSNGGENPHLSTEGSIYVGGKLAETLMEK